MTDTLTLPVSIRSFVSQQELIREGIGMSGAGVYYAGDLVLKIERADRESDVSLVMLRWLEGKVPVPRVLAEEVQNGYRYLVMERLDGVMSCDVAYLSKPAELVRLLAQGLRILWDVQIDDCPVDRTLEKKLPDARDQVDHGRYDLSNVDPDTFGEGGFSGPEELLSWLEEHRPDEDPVLSHGDYCLPNVFLKDGAVSGFLDLGRCGIADRYQDIALCWRSLRDNLNGSYGYSDPGFDPDSLFRELEIEPDWDKIRYYLLMDELF